MSASLDLQSLQATVEEALKSFDVGRALQAAREALKKRRRLYLAKNGGRNCVASQG